MSAKNFLVIVFLFLLSVAQAGFAARFDFVYRYWWLGYVNLIALSTVAAALFEKRRNNLSWAMALWGGFFLDMFSSRFFGFWMIIMAAAVFLIKNIIKRYVRIPSFW